MTRGKVPFGTAKFCGLRNARYLTWRDAFEVEFEDGIAFLETHQSIRIANKIKRSALPIRVKLDRTLRSGFFAHYDNGRSAEVSWSFIRELPPKPDSNVKCLGRVAQSGPNDFTAPKPCKLCSICDKTLLLRSEHQVSLASGVSATRPFRRDPISAPRKREALIASLRADLRLQRSDWQRRDKFAAQK